MSGAAVAALVPFVATTPLTVRSAGSPASQVPA